MAQSLCGGQRQRGSASVTTISAPEPQREGERRLLDGWQLGGVIHLCGPPGEICRQVDHTDADAWGEDRTVSASFFRGLLLYLRCQDIDPMGLRIHGARIADELDLSWITLPWPLALTDCHFSDRFSVEAATIAGLDLTGAHLPALAATGLHARGQVVIDRMRCPGEVRLNECRILGSFRALNATLGTAVQSTEASPNIALNLDLAQIDGVISMPGIFALGEVRLLGATIGGQLNCRGGTFKNPNGHALNADQAHITGGVFLHNEFVAEGEVRLLGATIGGQFACRGGTFTNPNDKALSADGAHITGDTILDEEFHAEGEVRLLGATIGGQLNCRGGTFTNPTGIALGADSAHIAGTVFLVGGFTAHGAVRFIGARLDQSLVARGSFAAGDDDCALNLERAVISTSLTLIPSKISGIVDLTDVACGTFRDRYECWPERLRLEGFTYRHIEGDGVDDSLRTDWLERHCDSSGKLVFSPRPYEQLAAVYRATGEDHRARAVGIARAKAVRRRMARGPRGWPRRFWSLLLGATVAHGYRPWMALLWLACFWTALWQIIRHADSLGLMRPLASDPKLVPPLARTVYALDVLIPVIDLGQRNYWQPEWPWSIAVWIGVIVGWTLVTAVVAGLTTAFRRS